MRRFFRTFGCEGPFITEEFMLLLATLGIAGIALAWWALLQVS